MERIEQEGKEEQNIPKEPMRFMLSVTRPHLWFAVGAFTAAFFAQVSGSSTWYMLKMLVDNALAAGDKVAQAHALLVWGGAYIGAIVCMNFGWRLSGFAGMEWITRSQATAYQRLYAYLSLHSHRYFSDRFAGSLSNKVSNASDGSTRMMEGFLWSYFGGVLSIFISAGFMWAVYPLIGILYMGLVVVMVLLNTALVRRRRPHVVSYAESSSSFRGAGVDFLSNISAVRQYARRPFELLRLHEALDDRRIKDIRQWRMAEWSLFLNNALIAAVLGLIVWIAVRQFANGAASVGDVVLIITLVFQTSHTLVFIGSSMNSAVRLYGEMQEGLEEVLAVHEIKDEPTAEEFSVVKGEIAFADVVFSYENQDVFNGLTLTIAPGERIGVVGGSGAGKTTLVSLLLRQHDIQGGAISIDGHNIADITQDSLRRAISLVPQDPQLFHRTIRENIAYGDLRATDADIEAAATAAYAHDFIETLPQKYDTMVGERGVKLSGGQRQRIVIARAILKNAPILVLDEATSALDSASEVVIQKALHTLMSGKTVIAIAHRLSTLREMDRIIVLEAGLVAESGTHEKLLKKKKGIYAGLWSHQVGGFISD